VEGGPAALAGLKRGSLFNEVNKVLYRNVKWFRGGLVIWHI